MTEQAFINNFEFASKLLEIHGKIAISQLPRLSESLDVSDYDAVGELAYQLRGAKDAQGKAMLVLHVDGVLEVLCQRCLDKMQLPVDVHVDFLVVEDENDIPPPEEEGDEIDYLVAEPKMSVWQLVEDEVMLALPLAPMHENTECANVSVGGTGQKRENPFKVLQGLKLDKH